MNYSLSNNDIEKFFNGKINIYTYDQLSQFHNIDEVLSPYGRAIILYFWKRNPTEGHWIALFRTNRNTIEFFNSYGTVPDKTLNDIPTGFKKRNGKISKY